MKPSMIARLDLLAAAREAGLLEQVRQHSATLARGQAQDEVLAAYRARLSESWRHGAPVAAAQARIAEHFASGTEAVAEQIAQMRAEAQARLAHAADELAVLRAHRRQLANRLAEAARAAGTQAEQKAERTRIWRRRP